MVEGNASKKVTFIQTTWINPFNKVSNKVSKLDESNSPSLPIDGRNEKKNLTDKQTTKGL